MTDVDIIKELPSRTKGKWVVTLCEAETKMGEKLYGLSCNKCGKFTFITNAMKDGMITPKCCPFCLTDMRGDTDV